jgi:hypothetical protein
MATRSQETLFDSFNSVSGGQGTSGEAISGTASSLVSTLDELTRQAGQLIASARESSSTELPDSAQSESSNAVALAGRALSNSRSGSELYSVDVSAQSGSRLNTSPTTEGVGQATTASGGTSALSIASTIFESGLGIVPLVSGLLGLFGGGSSSPPPLERYIMPDRLYFTGAETDGAIGNADYDQFGMPRAYGGLTSAMSTPVNSGAPAPTSAGTTGGASPQISVTVQAMDSQSFLDHSSEIAQAVRQAMLSLSSVNDVMNDL